jgi:DNA-binding NarL/FixJ family response regulator
MIARGLTNREIGYELHMSKYTVAQHIKEMFKRTGSVNRTDLINRAHITGILNDGLDGIGPSER